MQKDRKIAVTVWVFCVLVLALRVSSAESTTYVPKASESEITIYGVISFSGEQPLPQICPRPYLCFSPNTSQPSAYLFIPFVEFTESQSQTFSIHLEHGWNFISIPIEVKQ
jgi:hypothetical protein